MNISIENIFENLENLSEECFEEILEKVFENFDTDRREKILSALQQAKDGKYRTKAVKVLGKIQQRINKADNKNRKDAKNSGITFTNKIVN